MRNATCKQEAWPEQISVTTLFRFQFLVGVHDSLEFS